MKPERLIHWFSLDQRFIRKGITKNIRNQFGRMIIKAFVEQLGDLFYDEYVPVEIIIEAQEAPPASMKDAEAKKLCDFNLPLLKGVDAEYAVENVIEALSGAAFLNRKQVAKISFTKSYGWVDKIKIGIGVFKK